MPEIVTPTGSVILDGTSYSGADIKVVMHLYGSDAIDTKINALDLEITKLLIENAQQNIVGSTSVSNLSPQAITANQNIIKQLQVETEFLRSGQATYVTKTLAELQTISVSTYREKYPVRALATTYPKGFTRGPRTIAGSMVFTVFDKNVLYELQQTSLGEFDTSNVYTSGLIDQLPPMDITILFANELGQRSRMALYGVEFVSEGQTMSINDIFIENTVQYVARDIDPMIKSQDRRSKVLTPGSKLASDLKKEGAAQEFIADSDPFDRFKNRNDPFR